MTQDSLKYMPAHDAIRTCAGTFCECAGWFTKMCRHMTQLERKANPSRPFRPLFALVSQIPTAHRAHGVCPARLAAFFSEERGCAALPTHNTTDKPLHSTFIGSWPAAADAVCSCNPMWCGIARLYFSQPNNTVRSRPPQAVIVVLLLSLPPLFLSLSLSHSHTHTLSLSHTHTHTRHTTPHDTPVALSATRHMASANTCQCISFILK